MSSRIPQWVKMSIQLPFNISCITSTRLLFNFIMRITLIKNYIPLFIGHTPDFLYGIVDLYEET